MVMTVENVVMIICIVTLGIVAIFSGVVYYKGIQSLLSYTQTVTEIHKIETASLMDRMHSDNFSQFKNAEIVMEKLKIPPKPKEDTSHIEPC